MMETLLVVIKTKSSTPASQDFRARAYDILLLDTKLSTYDKSRTLKQLPKTTLTYEQDPTKSLLSYIFQRTGGVHGGLKGKRAVFLSLSRSGSAVSDRDSMSKSGSLFCIPIDSSDRLKPGFRETSPDTPCFYSLDFLLDSLNNSLLNYASQTRTMLLRLESWLKERHKIPGAIDLLFSSPPENRLKCSILNPAYVNANNVYTQTGMNQLGSRNSVHLPVEIFDRSVANEALAKMMAIEKSDIVVMNPLFGAGLPFKNRCEAVVVNHHWGMKPNYKNITIPKTLRGKWMSDFPLHKLALEGNAKEIKQLIAEGYPVAQKDRDSWAAIHFAAWKGHLEAIEALLVEGDCSVNITNDNGSTPLHLAARCGHPYVVELLLDHTGIDVNALDKEGNTPLVCCESNSGVAWQDAAKLIKTAADKPAPKIKVYLMDGSHRELCLMSGANTTVQQLHNQMLKELKMSEDAGRKFTIWISSRNLQLQLKLDHKPIPHLNDWRRTIISMFTDQEPTKEVPLLYWKRDAILTVADEKKVRDQMAVDLLFHEAYHNYITSLYPCADEDIVNASSILMQMRLGDFDRRKTATFFSLEKNMQQLIPVSKLKSRNANWANKIQAKYKEFSTKSKDKTFKTLQLHFLSICWNLTVYGSAFFTGYVQLKSSKSPTMVYVGVNDIGIHIIHGQNKTMLQSFGYKDIEKRHISEPGQPAVLEVRLKDRSLRGGLNIVTKQAGLIFHLMSKLSQLTASVS